MTVSNEQTQQTSPSLRTFFAELLTPQFLLAVVVVVGWFGALLGPLGAVSGLFDRLSDSTASQQALHSGVQSVLALSGLFSTVVGTVFGYYFGSSRSNHTLQLLQQAHERAAVAEHTLSTQKSPP